MRHPLHPALVHFPIACWSLATASDFAGVVSAAMPWRLAGILMAIGTAMAVMAMTAGFVEFLKVEADSPAMRDINRHMLLAATAWSCYAASLFLRWDAGSFTRPGTLAIALSAAGFVALCLTGWLGGKLVYGHGIGVGPAPR